MSGGPYFDDYRNDDYADEWFAMRDRFKSWLVAVLGRRAAARDDGDIHPNRKVRRVSLSSKRPSLLGKFPKAGRDKNTGQNE